MIPNFSTIACSARQFDRTTLARDDPPIGTTMLGKAQNFKSRHCLGLDWNISRLGAFTLEDESPLSTIGLQVGPLHLGQLVNAKSRVEQDVNDCTIPRSRIFGLAEYVELIPAFAGLGAPVAFGESLWAVLSRVRAADC